MISSAAPLQGRAAVSIDRCIDLAGFTPLELNVFVWPAWAGHCAAVCRKPAGLASLL